MVVRVPVRVPVRVSVVVIIISQVWGIIPRIKGVLELVPLVLLQLHGNLLVMSTSQQRCTVKVVSNQHKKATLARKHRLSYLPYPTIARFVLGLCLLTTTLLTALFSPRQTDPQARCRERLLPPSHSCARR